MLDISFSEIAVIGAVALVVLGPERLPKVARTAGHLFGRLQRYVATVKSDISREMEASEFSKMKQEVEDAARGFETTVRAETNAINAEVEKASASVNASLEEASATPALAAPATPSFGTAHPAPPLSQDEIIAAQEASFLPASPAAAATANPVTAGLNGQLRFDFGIEPPRPVPQGRE